MILRSIEVSGWRCFLEQVAVGPFSEKINVIYGPNGTGKTTLFEALRRALMDSHAVTGLDISEIRPWGRALLPKVAVIFHHEGTDYRLFKQFLDEGSSRVERQENGGFRPLAEGRPADDLVRALLTKDSPGRGLSQNRHWGIAQVLWAPQGELKLGELSGNLIADIHSILGVQLADHATGPIEMKISELYSLYFTPQGKLKTGKGAPPIAKMHEDLVAAKAARAKADQELSRSEEVSRKVEDLKALSQQKSLEAEEFGRSLQKAREIADQYRSLASARSIRKSNCERFEAQYRELHKHLRMIEDAERELADHDAALTKLNEELPAREKESEEKSKIKDEAKTRLDEIRAKGENIALTEKTAEDARSYLEAQRDSNTLNRRLEKLEGSEKALAALEKERATHVAPDAKGIKQLRKIINERDELKLRIESSMLELELLPEVAGQLDVVKGEEPGSIPLAPGRPVAIKGLPEIVAAIRGIAGIHVQGPAGDIEELRLAFRDKQDRIEELTRPFGTDHLEALEALFDEAADLDRRIGVAKKEIAMLCEDGEKNYLKSELSRLKAVLAEIEKIHADWKKSPPDQEILRREADDLKREHRRAVREAEKIWESAETNASRARETVSGLISKREDIEKNIRGVESRLKSATSDGKSKEERHKEIQQVLLDRDAAKAALNAIDEKLKAFEGDPVETLTKTEKSLEAIRISLQEIRDSERTAMGNLEVLVSSGPYSALARAEEEISRLEMDIQKETIRMDAIKLLYETITNCRTEAISAVAQPVEESASRLMHRIAGRRLGKIDISEDFVPKGVSPEPIGSSVDLGNLSGGEKEQLYFATRLALAHVLAKDERQMVVLDDVLTATDAGRFTRILTILEEAAEKLQILILTCHPERYRALSEANFFDLEAIIGHGASIG